MKKLLIASVVLVAAVGCQKDEPLEPHQAANSAAPAASATAPATAAAPAESAPTSPPVAAAATGIASTDGEQAGVKLNVTEFKRTSGDTVTLKFVIINNG